MTVLAGCSGNQSALDAQGAPAIAIEKLIVGIVALCTVIWLLVVIVLAFALLRGRRNQSKTSERRMTVVVSAAVAATAVIIAGLTGASFYTTREIGMPDDAGMTVTVTGKQWWWHVVYAAGDAGSGFETANEIHIPVGRDVRVELVGGDVIHSFWVPSLAGKQDMVPGRSNILLLRAEKPGLYRGQCAEFCGLQHSHMAFMVVAEAPEDFARWANGQRAGRSSPVAPDAAAGEAAFMAKPCAACHTVRGTSATGRAGPDLTHVGSRLMLAAGLFERTRGTMAAWIADPQTLKPGNNMPMVPLTSLELRNISAYMESLK